MQNQLNKQIQDNIRILDCLFRTMSTAENISLGNQKNKKYAKYDEKNVCSWKGPDQIKDDFLMNIECLNSMINIFKKRYEGKKIKFPLDLPMETVLYDLEVYKKIIASKQPKLVTYFDDFKKLIKGENCKRYTEKELLSSYKKESPMNEKMANKTLFTILTGAAREEERMQKKLEKYDMQGEIVEDLDEKYDESLNNNQDWDDDENNYQ